MKSIWAKLAAALLAAAILAYVGVYAYNQIYSPYKTETVYENTATDFVEARGVVFRDESVLTQKVAADAVIRYYYPNGSKVAKGETVAQIYDKADDLKFNFQIEQLNREIQALKACETSTTGGAQTDKLNTSLNEEQLRLLRLIDDHALTDLSETKYAILEELNKKQILIGKLKSVKARIQSLQTQKDKLKSRVSGKHQTIKAGGSGFFVDETDGFETRITYKDGRRPTVQTLETLLKQKKTESEHAVGKVITGYEWRFAILVDKDDLMKFTEGRELGVTFSSFADDEVDMQIEKVAPDARSDRAVVVLKSDLMDENIATLRTDTVKVNFKTDKGLKVSKQALYIQDGEKGVYCMLGNEMIFKKVDILFETEDYFLSKQHPEDSSYLKIYDDVVVKGKDLYDKQRAE